MGNRFMLNEKIHSAFFWGKAQFDINTLVTIRPIWAHRGICINWIIHW